MQLSSLTLHGFKSFGERTRIEFADGVTAIVGPNGSGKSNVIDALRWATGGGRASEFRAGSKTDLIFHGAAGKRSVGYAEVELELLQKNRSLNVTRSIYKDGNTKLKLDGANARFLDVEERLSGSGLGRSALAVISQGEVGQVLTADPAKLLSYVAEAAGIARLSSRRTQAQDRLDTARTHLLRLEDIILELRGALEQLVAEAAQAERHTVLSREALQLRYTLSVRRVEALKGEIEKLSLERGELVESLDAGRAELAHTREHWQNLRNEVSELEGAYRQALTEAEAKRGDVRVAEERLQAAQLQKDTAERELQTVLSELKRLESATAPQAPADQSILESDLKQKRELFEELQSKLVTQENEVAARENELSTSRQAANEANEIWVKYLSYKEQLESQQTTLKERLATTPEAPAELTQLEARLTTLKSQSEQAQNDAEAKREALNASVQRHAQHEAEAQALTRAAERNRAAFEARRGYAQGPRLALSSGIKGVLGSVADLIRVQKRYRKAVASALGRRSEYVVVDSADTAQSVIDFVKKAGGWVTVLPLELIQARTPQLASDIAAAPGVIGLAAEQVETDASYQTIVNQLLGSTTLVETMPQAVTLARSQRRRPRLITLDGHVLEGYGAMTGGKSRVDESVLGAAAELEEAQASAAAAREQAEASAAEVAKAQDALRDAHRRRAEAQDVLEQQQKKLNNARERSRLEESLRNELSSQLERVQTQLADLNEPEQSEAVSFVQEEQALAQLRSELVQQRSELNTAAERYRDLSQQVALASERQQRYLEDVKRFEAEQLRVKTMRERREDLQSSLTTFVKALDTANTTLEEARAALPQDLNDKKDLFETAKTQSNTTEKRLADLTEAQAAAAEKLESVKLTLARREAAQEIAEEELAAFPDGIATLELSARAARERLSRAEEELEAIGLVNHRAAHELKEQRERFEDLELQSVQATLAVSELEAALGRIDTETTTRLESATAAMREHFRAYVSQLFGDEAVGDITVHYEEERPIGMSIQLQPPGKRTTSLNLLSVGERTMGAMAFLFSLMQGEEGNALPLAILDEVDAPLDEANIRRYCQFVEQLAKNGTQFVLITHQKATFDIADVLWGVTSDRGVSRVFSISRKAYAEVG